MKERISISEDKIEEMDIAVKELQPRLQFPAKCSITMGGGEKTFHDKSKSKQCLSINPTLQKVLNGKLQSEESHHT